MNADNILFHPHYLGELMTEPQKGKTGLSETCKKRLVKVFIEEKYKRVDKLENKYVKKGLKVEEDSLTVYSRVKKVAYFKNEATISNSFIIGTPDSGDKKDITRSKVIVDTKSSWDLFTFWNSRINPLDKAYYWQGQGYCDLTGAEKVIIAFCLVNTPEGMIYDECKKLQWKMGVINPDNNALYQEAAAQIEKNMTYDDIPLAEKMFELEVLRDDEAIERMHNRVIECREYMNKHFFSKELIAA